MTNEDRLEEIRVLLDLGSNMQRCIEYGRYDEKPLQARSTWSDGRPLPLGTVDVSATQQFQDSEGRRLEAADNDHPDAPPVSWKVRVFQTNGGKLSRTAEAASIEEALEAIRKALRSEFGTIAGFITEKLASLRP